MYEAWTIYLSSDCDDPIFARKFCGMTTVRDYDSYPGTVSSISELYEQKDLMDMYIQSLEKYKSRHKRAWPTRLVRGTAGSYEDDIDARVRKLPSLVQSEICRLLADREDATSSRFHNRAWSVVMMQEQLHRRFADASPKVIDKRHRLRFWKNSGKNDRSEYFFIIRGREGRLISDPKGQSEFKRFENPWHYADAAEARQKTREESRKPREKRGRTVPPPSYRYSPPPPPVAPTFPNRGMYTAPGGYSRPHIGMPHYPPPGGPPAPGMARPHSQPYQQPPPAPTPPVSYPPPPPVQYVRGSTNCFGGPTYQVSTATPPPGLPRSTIYAPPPAPRPLMYVPQPNPTNRSFGPYSGPYTFTRCGGASNGMQTYQSGPPAPTAPPAILPPQTSYRPLPYGGFRPGNCVPGVNWPPGIVVSTSEPNPVAGNAYPATVSRCIEEPGKLAGSAKEAHEESVHLRYDHDASDAGSVRSWMSRNRESEVTEPVQEKGDETLNAHEDPEHIAQQEYLTLKMNELIAANKRRNEERETKELAENDGVESSSVMSAGSCND